MAAGSEVKGAVGGWSEFVPQHRENMQNCCPASALGTVHFEEAELFPSEQTSASLQICCTLTCTFLISLECMDTFS